MRSHVFVFWYPNLKVSDSDFVRDFRFWRRCCWRFRFSRMLQCRFENSYRLFEWAGIAQSVLRLATGRTVRGSNPGGGEIFRTRPDRSWGPPTLPYNGYRVFPGCKAAAGGVDHPPPSSAEVKERVKLYLYSPSGSSWPVLEWTLPLPLPTFGTILVCSSVG